MREVSGEIVIPSGCTAVSGATALVEVRDVSRADAPSTVVAQTRLTNIGLRSGDRIPFTLAVTEVSGAQSLALRVHISQDASSEVKSGDLLSTRSYPVPSHGNISRMTVLLTLI